MFYMHIVLNYVQCLQINMYCTFTLINYYIISMFVKIPTCFKAGIFYKANNRMIIFLKIIYIIYIYIYIFIEKLLHKIMIFKTEPQKYLDRNHDICIKLVEII